jgi:predicted secreted hydrolase
MQHGDLIGGPIGAADDTEIKCKGTAGEIGRDLPAEKGSFRRIAMWTISLNALLALSIGLPCAPVYSASADAASPLVRIPQDEAPHDDETEWWYFSGHLRGFDIFGKPHSYGYELVFFQFDFPNQAQPVYQANLDLTDLTGGNFHRYLKLFLA